MKVRKELVAALGSLMLSGTMLLANPALADVAAQSAEKDAKPAKKLSRKELNKLNGLKCTRVRETGSRVSKKVCTTAAQREASARREREKVHALENRPVLDSPVGN